MALRGEPVHINLSLEDDGGNAHDFDALDNTSSVLPVTDVVDRPHPKGPAPVPPSVKSPSKGFPTHKKRIDASKLKAQQAVPSRSLSSTAPYIEQQNVQESPTDAGIPQEEAPERESIDRENRQKLASMSGTDIARERKELFDGLSPSLIQHLLSRSKLDNNVDGGPGQNTPLPIDADAVRFNVCKGTSPVRSQDDKRAHFKQIEEVGKVDERVQDSSQSAPASIQEILQSDSPAFHFPKPETVPELDPSSPSFFQDLHQKYFAELPADPSKLAWMQEGEHDPNYSPNSEIIEIPNLRFNFNGSLITPRQAEKISVTEGLHHHGEAPSSAGYTVLELARLARSTVATQRCIAYQALGRIMYRLGRGEFGSLDEKIPKGLWKCVNDGRVIEALQEEVNRRSGHASANAYATEALWLWRKGGGQRLRAA